MKRFISGFLFGALLFAVPAIANNSKTVEAFYNNIKLSVYGQIVDTEGNEPFIVGGRTYVPARYVAEAMGGVVKWNESENTVEVIKGAVAGISKFTSDGLKAINNGTQYLIYAHSVADKYNLEVNTSQDKKTVTFYSRENSKTISFPTLWLNSAIAVSIDSHENIILPFVSSN